MKYKKDNMILTIEPEEYPESPRQWDNFGKLVCVHKRYNLGDELGLDINEINSFEELKEYLIKELKAEIILSVYMYDHSGITISTSKTYPYNDRWDAGQIGFIFCTKEDRERNKMTDEKAVEALEYEIVVYDQYVTGDIYSYTIEEEKICKECNHKSYEHIDSTGGFFGSNFKENGLYESAGIKDLDKDGWKEIEE